MVQPLTVPPYVAGLASSQHDVFQFNRDGWYFLFPREDYIECESCNEWYHFSCEGLDENNPPDVYSCKRCRQLAAKGQKVPALERRRNKAKTNEYLSEMVRLLVDGVACVAGYWWYYLGRRCVRKERQSEVTLKCSVFESRAGKCGRRGLAGCEFVVGATGGSD